MTAENMIASVLREFVEPSEDGQRDAEMRIAALREELQEASERQRIVDLGDFLDAEDALYGEALFAVERGDIALAKRLLHHCMPLDSPAVEDLLADLASQPCLQQEQSEQTIMSLTEATRKLTEVSQALAAELNRVTQERDFLRASLAHDYETGLPEEEIQTVVRADEGILFGPNPG